MVEVPSQFPSYIKYDFLLTLLGVITWFCLLYLIIIKKVTLPVLVSLPLSSLGSMLLLYGLSEMRSNYEQEKELLSLENELKKLELSEKIRKFHE